MAEAMDQDQDEIIEPEGEEVRMRRMQMNFEWHVTVMQCVQLDYDAPAEHDDGPAEEEGDGPADAEGGGEEADVAACEPVATEEQPVQQATPAKPQE